MFRYLAACAALLSFAGCASEQRTPEEPLPEFVYTPEPDFKVTYRGAAERGDGSLVHSMPYTVVTPGPDTKAVAVNVRAVQLREGAAEELLGDMASVLGAISLDPDTAKILTNRHRDRRLRVMNLTPSSPGRSLILWEGQRGTVAILNQVPYISGFEVTREDAVTADGRRTQAQIASPVVDNVLYGLFLAVTVSRGEGENLHVELDVEINELVLPLPTAKVEVMSSELTIQAPLVFRQRVKGIGEVEPGRVMAITGLINRDGGRWVLLVSADNTKETPTTPPPHPKQD